MIGLLVVILSVGGVLTNQTSSISFDSEYDGQQLIHRGHATVPGDVPWHAGIYMPTPSGYVLLCGGTLISPTIVVTAAHCFWNHKANREIPDLNTYHVTLGKTYRVYDFDILRPNVQVLQVKRVVLFPRFEGAVARNLEYDLAVIETRTPANVTDSVRPASVALNHGNPANGSVGVVAGWGYTENGSLSETLHSIALPYDTCYHDTCYASLGGNRFKRLFTSDKFCAGYSNVGKSVCPGDSGGGFVVMEGVGESRRPVVRGVVSLDFRPQSNTQSSTGCYALHYTGFTNLGELRFVEWLRGFLPSVPCPAVTTSSAVREVFCDKDQEDVDCTQPMLPGTVARSLCTAGHRAGKRTSKTATCRRDGSWSNAGINCQRPDRLDYHHLPGQVNRYKHHGIILTWQDAKTSCEAEGSHLVILNSDAEFTAVIDLVRKHQRRDVPSSCAGGGCIWLGLQESDTRQNEFITVLGQPLSATGFTRWHPGRPSSSSLGDVVYIHPDDPGMFDMPATLGYKWPYICELEV